MLISVYLRSSAAKFFSSEPATSGSGRHYRSGVPYWRNAGAQNRGDRICRFRALPIPHGRSLLDEGCAPANRRTQAAQSPKRAGTPSFLRSWPQVRPASFSPLLIGVSPPSMKTILSEAAPATFQSPSYRGKPSFQITADQSQAVMKFQSPSYRGKPSFIRHEDPGNDRQSGFSPLLIGVSPPSNGSVYVGPYSLMFQSPSYRGKPSFVGRQ